MEEGIGVIILQKIKTPRSNLPRVSLRLLLEWQGQLPVDADEAINLMLSNHRFVFFGNLATTLQHRAVRESRGQGSWAEMSEVFIFDKRRSWVRLNLRTELSRHIPKLELTEALEAIAFEPLVTPLREAFANMTEDERQANRYARKALEPKFDAKKSVAADLGLDEDDVLTSENVLAELDGELIELVA